MTEDLPATADAVPRPEELEAVGKACFALHARMTARVLTRAYEAALRPLGLTVAQFGLLGSIGHGAAVSGTALADKLGLERTTLVRNLKILTGRGWVEPVPCDRRGLGHRLTPAGTETLQRAIPAWRAAQSEVEARLAGTTPDEARTALRALRRAAYGTA